MNQPKVTRRSLLGLSLGAAAALMLDACDHHEPAAGPAVSASARSERIYGPITPQRPFGPVLPANTAAGAPAAGAPAPGVVNAWSTPVYSLTDYVRHFPQASFPAEAIMLTIDDGPNPTWTPKVLQLLESYDVQATFFVIGEEAVAHPDLVRAVVGAGHHVANHTFHHPIDLPSLSPDRISTEIVNTQQAITEAAGVTPRMFRSPGGNWGGDVYSAVAQQDLVPLDWDVDPRDWSRPGAQHIESDLLGARPGQILLCHDGGGDRSQTYAALATVIPQLLARGLTFVTLPQ